MQAEKEPGRMPDFVPIPYGVFTDPNLTPMEKLAIGRLTLYAGKDGRCYPSHETLAQELCLKRRQLIEVLRSLHRKGKLDWQRTGKSNSYRFPDVQSTAHLDIGDVQRTAQQMCSGPHNRCAVDCTQREVAREERKESVEESHMLITPERIEHAQQALGGHRRSGALPDLWITKKILGVFSDIAGFDAWMSAIRITLDPSKIRGRGYALYLADAQRWVAAGGQEPAQAVLPEVKAKRSPYFDPTTITGPRPATAETAGQRIMRMAYSERDMPIPG